MAEESKHRQIGLQMNWFFVFYIRSFPSLQTTVHINPIRDTVELISFAENAKHFVAMIIDSKIGTRKEMLMSKFPNSELKGCYEIVYSYAASNMLS